MEIPIGKDGSYSLPDPTETEEIDAKYSEKLRVETSGYDGRSIPISHSAAAFQGLYVRDIYLDEDCDIFADELVINEDVPDSDDPEYRIRHIIGQPDEAEVRKLKQRMNSGRVEPDKRGRQKYVTTSPVRAAMECYAKWMRRVDGATVADQPYSAVNREAFLSTIDPLVKLRVVRIVVDELTGGLLD